MTRPIKFTDIAVFQPSSYSYIKSLKNSGARFNFVKLTEGNSYVNPSAPRQIDNSLSVFGSVGVYHFWHGESANHFIKTAHEYGLHFDSTKVALDVESGDLPYSCTSGINAFESQLVKAGFKPGNIWTYASTSWINEGRVKPSKLKYGFVWAAMYPYPNVYSDNKLTAHSSLNPGYNAWQFSGLGSQDWSYDYTGTLLSNPKPKHRVIKHVAEKPAEHYLKYGQVFRALTSINGYRDPEFKLKNGNVLAKGSVIHGSILRFNGYTRLDTTIGWFSTNTKYLKAVK